MNIGIVRVEEMAVARMAVLQAWRGAGGIREVVVTEEMLMQPALPLAVEKGIAGAEVVFIAVPGAYSAPLARQALRLGKHIFLGRAALPAMADCKALVALGEEAGVELGISRLMRFHPFLKLLPAAWRATALAVHHDTITHHPAHFQQMLEDAIDLCCNLAGTGEVRRVEAQLVQNEPAHPGSLMVGFRFQNGTYAQIQLRQGVARGKQLVYAGGRSFELEADLANHAFFTRHPSDRENDSGRFAFESHPLSQVNLVEIETTRFLNALTEKKPVPVSVLDGLQTLRLIETIRKNLR